MQQRKMHLGKNSTKMDGDRGKQFNTRNNKISHYFSTKPIALAEGKKRYKHINACSVYFDFLQTENFFLQHSIKQKNNIGRNSIHTWLDKQINIYIARLNFIVKAKKNFKNKL